MKAMILAAGMGERMRPLTEERAKPSLPLLTRSIIVHTLSYLKGHGVDQAMINLHYQPDSIRALVGDGGRLGLKVQYSEEQTILGTAGGLKKVEPFFSDGGTFIMINGDFFTDCDLTAAIAEHKKSGAVATMILAPHQPGTDYGNVQIDAEGRVRSIAGIGAGRPLQSGSEQPGSEGVKQLSGFAFIGIHILEPSIFQTIPKGVRYEINREVYPLLLQQGGLIKGYVHQGFWREMGTPRLYLDGSIAILGEGKDQGLGPLRVADGIYLEQVKMPVTTTSAAPILIGRGSTIGAQCSFLGGVIVGRQCSIGPDCALRSTMLWDGARIGARVQLTDCIVTSGVYVPPKSSLAGRILFRVDGYQGNRDNLERVGNCWAYRIQ